MVIDIRVVVNVSVDFTVLKKLLFGAFCACFLAVFFPKYAG
jgi:hypothetical protein